MPKMFQNLEFVQVVNFEFIGLLKNNGTKNLLIFDYSCEKFCIWKVLLVLLLLEDIMDWVIAALGRFGFTKTSVGESWHQKHAHFSLQTSFWCDASYYAYRTVGELFRASWLVTRRNIGSLKSFFDRLVATNSWSNTILYKNYIHSLKN